MVERGQQLERISKTCTELSEARKGLAEGLGMWTFGRSQLVFKVQDIRVVG